MKKKIVNISLIVLALIFLSSFVLRQYESFMYMKNFKDNGKNEPYSQGIPLHEMDLTVYRKYYPAQTLTKTNRKKSVILPCDIEYYHDKTDSNPSLTLKKGTEVYVLSSKSEHIEIGYAYQCWPDYDSKWRYGYPFLTSEFTDFPPDQKMYYVKLNQLERVAKAYCKNNIKPFERYVMVSEYVSNSTRLIDKILYSNGIFCAPRD